MQTTTALKNFLAIVAAAAMLAGCASGPAPVVDHSFGGSSGKSAPGPAGTAPATTSPSGVQTFGTGHANGTVSESGYTVAQGDTLYSIAFAHGIDFRTLAAQNNIPPPYVIHPGQLLQLNPPSATVATSTVAAGTTTTTTTTTNLPPATPQPAGTQPAAPVFGPVTTQTMTATGVAPSSSSTATAPVAAEAPVVQPPAATAPAVQPPVETPPPPVVATAAPAGPSRNVGGVDWQWPASGAVIGSFQAGAGGDGAGLDIAGDLGDPVRAAAAGTVVYSGNGLIGYGELIIIKHNDTYLSAYGHNSQRLVKEGQRVSAGQEIAEMGASGAPRVELHFEIRKNGQPVDPMGYLPKR